MQRMDIGNSAKHQSSSDALQSGPMETITFPQPRYVFLIIGLFLAVTFLAFGRTLLQDFAPLDDDLLITHNLAVRGMTPENLRTVFTTYDPELYIPLTFVSYQVNYLIGGLRPWIYHLTNILLHAGNALLVAWLLLLLTQKRHVALVAGLLFAVHPLHTEAVAWLAGRKDLLSTFFFLLSFIAYLHYRKGVAHNAPTTYVLSILSFLLALLSKVMAMTLPVALILSDLLMERRKWSWKILMEKIPYLMLSGIFLVVATAGKERILSHHTTWETALMAAKSTVFYLQKLLLPIHLGVFYPYRGAISLLESAFIVPVLIVLMLIGFTVFSLRWNRWIMFGVAFFLVTLAPTFINFHKGGEMYFASDRYPYLPSIGFFLIVAMALHGWSERSRLRMPSQRLLASIGVPLVIILCVLSSLQTRIWDSAESLFANTLRLHPESIAARVSLASMARRSGKYDQAIKLLRDGLGYGDDVQLRMGLGTVYAKVGRVDDAREQFIAAQTLDPLNPEPLVALGVLDEYEKNIPAAMEKYRKAVEMDSSYVSARNKLGSLLLEEGKTEEAEEQFRMALQWNPNTEGVLYNLSLILDAQHKSEEALASLEKANALSPDDPRIMTALAAHVLKTDPVRAGDLLKQVLRMDPGNQDAQRMVKELTG